jgi:hypothetical protein
MPSSQPAPPIISRAACHCSPAGAQRRPRRTGALRGQKIHDASPSYHNGGPGASAAPPATTVQALIAVIPDDRLREVLLALMLNGPMKAPAALPTAPTPRRPAKRRRGWTRGKPRGPRKAKRNGAVRKRSPGSRPPPDRERRRPGGQARCRCCLRATPAGGQENRRTRRRARRQRRQQRGQRPGGRHSREVLGARKRLEPGRPWLAVAREFDVKETVARGAYDAQRLPPQVGPMAVTRFLALKPS